MTSRGPAVGSGSLRGLAATVGALLAALVTFTVAALLLAFAPLLTAVRAGDGADPDPAFASAPLLALAALAPAAAAWLLAGFGRTAFAAALLGSLGLLAIGRAVVDIQLLVDPWSAQRPELFVPASLAELSAGPAVPVLLLGHVLTALAGLLALVALHRRGAEDAGDTGDDGAAVGSGSLVAALCAGTLAAAGLVSVPFRSTDPYLTSSAVVDAATPTLVGMLLVAGGAVLAACLAASAADPEVAAGGLTGAAIGVALVALPPLATAAASDAVRVSAGPFVALTGAALLAGTARFAGRRPAGSLDGDDLEDVRLPAALVLRRVAGVLAVGAGVAGLLGAALDQVTVSELIDPLVVYPARLLVPAGVLLVVLGTLQLVPRLGGVARPALATGWAAMPLAATATLDLALTASQLDGVGAGPGVWPVALALLLAPLAGAVAAVAGGAEREEDDLTLPRQPRADRPLLVGGALAAALAVPAFGLPLVTSADYQPAGLWTRFGVASWGLVGATVVVVAAGLLAPWSRPGRAAWLLLGAAAVVAVHLSAVPLVGARGEARATVAAGTWFAVACGLALVATAAVAWQRDRRDRLAERRTKYAPGRSKTGGRSGRAGASRPDAGRNRERSHPRGRRQART